MYQESSVRHTQMHLMAHPAKGFGCAARRDSLAGEQAFLLWRHHRQQCAANGLTKLLALTSARSAGAYLLCSHHVVLARRAVTSLS